MKRPVPSLLPSVALGLAALFLVGCGIFQDPVDEHGMTPLMRAAAAGEVHEVRRLLDRGARVEQRVRATPVRDLIAFLSFFQERPARSPGFTALHFAVSSGHVEAVRVLLEAGVGVGEGDLPGIHPVILATGPLTEDVEVLRVLLEAGAPPEPATGREGLTPLMSAAMWGRTEAAHLLLERGADVNSRSRTGETPLIHAARAGAAPVVLLLLEAGADPEVRDQRQGWTALSWAESRGHREAADVLREWGASEATEANRRLAEGVRRGDREEVARALEMGADPRTPSLGGGPLLHEAATRGDSELVGLLLEHGADPARRDGQGRTALDWAKVAGSQETVRVLEEAMADGGGALR